MSQQTQKTNTTLQHLFGKPGGIILAILLLLTLGWTINGSYDTLKNLFLTAQPTWWQPALLGIIPFSLILIIASLEFLRIRRHIHPKITRQDRHHPVQVILLFLSPPAEKGKLDKELIDRLVNDTSLTLADALERLQPHTWLMPLKGLEPHAPKLTKVIVISSKDSPDKENGTYRYLDLFKKLVQRYLGEKIAVVGLENFDQTLSKGIDFEEETANLVEVIETIYQSLATEKYATNDILIDITGGQKLNSIIGAAVSFAEGRLFQYVSTQTKQVEYFDMTYQISE